MPFGVLTQRLYWHSMYGNLAGFDSLPCYKLFFNHLNFTVMNNNLPFYVKIPALLFIGASFAYLVTYIVTH